MQRLRAPAAAAHHDAAASATAALGERGGRGGGVGSGGSVVDVDISVADDPSLVRLSVTADRRGEREGGAEEETAAAADRDPRGADQGDQDRDRR